METLEGTGLLPIESQWIVFTVAGVELAVPIETVREIIRLTDISPLPKAPGYLRGVLHVNGRVIAVMDLKKRFGFPQSSLREDARILIVEEKGQLLGILADKVQEVLKGSAQDTERADEPRLNVPLDFAPAHYRVSDRLVFFLDVPRLFVLNE